MGGLLDLGAVVHPFLQGPELLDLRAVVGGRLAFPLCYGFGSVVHELEGGFSTALHLSLTTRSRLAFVFLCFVNVGMDDARVLFKIAYNGSYKRSF
jgi:hypothetical protein